VPLFYRAPRDKEPEPVAERQRQSTREHAEAQADDAEFDEAGHRAIHEAVIGRDCEPDGAPYDAAVDCQRRQRLPRGVQHAHRQRAEEPAVEPAKRTDDEVVVNALPVCHTKRFFAPGASLYLSSSRAGIEN
jgi:hypothetical protein